MSAASVVVVVPSGEHLRRKGRHGVVCRFLPVWSMPGRFV